MNENDVQKRGWGVELWESYHQHNREKIIEKKTKIRLELSRLMFGEVHVLLIIWIVTSLMG